MRTFTFFAVMEILKPVSYFVSVSVICLSVCLFLSPSLSSPRCVHYDLGGGGRGRGRGREGR